MSALWAAVGDGQFWLLVAVGFVAQLVDGSLGMAYGVSCNSLLLALTAISPRAAGVSIHTAEIFTTLASALAHRRMRNVSPLLFKRLIVPGVCGGILGAALLSRLEWRFLRPAVCCYLVLMGLRILWKAHTYRAPRRDEAPADLLSAEGAAGLDKALISEDRLLKAAPPLALAGAALDAMGGGGWGPVVTSGLLARTGRPHLVIGSVNAVEFFVTIAEVAVFWVMLGAEGNVFTSVMGEGRGCLQAVPALILGGVLAAPWGACICRRLPVRVMLYAVGLVVLALNLYSLYGFLR